MPWAALPWGDERFKQISSNLSTEFEVNGIPHLTLLNGDGKILHISGDEIISKYGEKGFPFSSQQLETVEREVQQLSLSALRSLSASMLSPFLSDSVDYLCIVLGSPHEDRAVSALARAVPIIDQDHKDRFKAMYIPWDDEEDENHRFAACGLPSVSLTDRESRALIRQAVGYPVTASQLVLIARGEQGASRSQSLTCGGRCSSTAPEGTPGRRGHWTGLSRI